MPSSLVLALALALAVPAAQESAPAAPQDAAPPQEQAASGVVREVVLQGETRLTEEALRLQIRTKAGEPYSREIADADLKALASRYQIWGEVRAEELADGGVRVVFSLQQVPSIRRVEFRGHREIDEDDLREALRLSENNVPPEGWHIDRNLAVALRTLEERYHDEGFLAVEIDGRIEKLGDDYVFVVEILEGPEVVVDEVDFVGFEDFTAGVGSLVSSHPLRSLMSTSRSFLVFTSSYKPKVLQEDVVKIEQFLRDEGYLDARVAVESVTLDPDGEEVDLVIRVDQGPRYTVGAIRFEGIERFAEDELRALVRMREGEPYRKSRWLRDRSAILGHYRQRGFIRAGIPVAPGESADPSTARVDLTIAITEDEPKRVRDVRVVGNRSTRDDVVRRELDLHPGDLFDGDEMLAAEDRLRATGFFSDEQGRPLAWVETEPTDDPRLEDIVIRVEDGTNGLFALTGGVASGQGFFVGTDLQIENFDWSDLPSGPGSLVEEFLAQNCFHGAGQKLSLRARPGSQFSSYVLQFTEPYLTGPVRQPVFMTTSLQYREFLSRFYEEERTGGAISVGKRLSRQTSLALGFRQDHVRISDVLDRPGDPIEDLLAVEGGNGVRGVYLDASYHDFDSLRNPTDGQRVGGAIELVGGPLGADVDAVKLTLSGEKLWPLWENEELQRHVLSVRGAYAWSQGFRDTGELPFFERYFAGGPGQFLPLRGFEFRGVGPHDGNFAKGGGAGWVVNTEYVFPLVETYDARLRENQPFLRGVVFVDQGMLEERGGDLWTGKWRLSAGAGLRIRIPFQIFSAPLEFYYGVPIQRRRDDERESFQINFTTQF